MEQGAALWRGRKKTGVKAKKKNTNPGLSVGKKKREATKKMGGGCWWGAL